MFDRVGRRATSERVRLAVIVALTIALAGGFVITALWPPPNGAVLRAEAAHQLRDSQAAKGGR